MNLPQTADYLSVAERLETMGNKIIIIIIIMTSIR